MLLLVFSFLKEPNFSVSYYINIKTTEEPHIFTYNVVESYFKTKIKLNLNVLLDFVIFELIFSLVFDCHKKY